MEMQVYVTIELFKGLVESVQVFEMEESARQLETEWLNKTGIKDAMGREAKAGEGTEFHVVETVLRR